MQARARRLIGLGVALLLLAGLVWVVGPVELARAVVGLDPGWMLLAGTVYLSLFLLKAAKWDALLAAGGVRIGYPSVLAAVVSANASNLLLPAKLGDTVRGYVVKRRGGVSFWYAMSSSMIDRVLDFYGIAVVAGLAVALLPLPGVPAGAGLALQVAVGVGLIVGLGMVFSRHLLILAERVFLHKYEGAQRFFDEVVKPVDAFRRRWPVSLTLAAVAAIVWTAEGVVTFWVGRAAGLDAGLVLVVFAVMLANLTKAFPVTPGGLGTYEAALAAVLVWGGVSVELAGVAAVVDHALKNLLTLAASVPAGSFLGIDVANPPGEDESGGGPSEDLDSRVDGA